MVILFPHRYSLLCKGYRIITAGGWRIELKIIYNCPLPGSVFGMGVIMKALLLPWWLLQQRVCRLSTTPAHSLLVS